MLNTVVKKLNSIGIDENEIVTYCCGDLNMSCESCFTFLVLTKDKIIKIENKTLNTSLNAEPFCDDDAVITVFERKKCSHFKSVSNVCGVSVSVMYENKGVCLINSSNRFSDEILIFKYHLCKRSLMLLIGITELLPRHNHKAVIFLYLKLCRISLYCKNILHPLIGVILRLHL